jgi:hypothetical protein
VTAHQDVEAVAMVRTLLDKAAEERDSARPAGPGGPNVHHRDGSFARRGRIVDFEPGLEILRESPDT